VRHVRSGTNGAASTDAALSSLHGYVDDVNQVGVGPRPGLGASGGRETGHASGDERVAPEVHFPGLEFVALALRAHGYGGRGCLGFEWPHLGVVWTDGAVGGFGDLVPDAGDFAEGFGDDQPGVV
jgi:hypothetical protein